MKKLENLWIDTEEPTSDSERLTPFYLNRIILIKQMNELVTVLNKLRKEWNKWNE